MTEGMAPRETTVSIKLCFHNCRFIDGCTYFSAVAEALESAKEEIFITDWWFVYIILSSLNNVVLFSDCARIIYKSFG